MVVLSNIGEVSSFSVIARLSRSKTNYRHRGRAVSAGNVSGALAARQHGNY